MIWMAQFASTVKRTNVQVNIPNSCWFFDDSTRASVTVTLAPACCCSFVAEREEKIFFDVSYQNSFIFQKNELWNSHALLSRVPIIHRCERAFMRVTSWAGNFGGFECMNLRGDEGIIILTYSLANSLFHSKLYWLYSTQRRFAFPQYNEISESALLASDPQDQGLYISDLSFSAILIITSEKTFITWTSVVQPYIFIPQWSISIWNL